MFINVQTYKKWFLFNLSLSGHEIKFIRLSMKPVTCVKHFRDKIVKEERTKCLECPMKFKFIF